MTNGSIAGLVVFVLSSNGEAVLVNIVGELDPALLGRLARQFNVPQLRQLKDIKVPKDEATGRRTRRASEADSDE
jgi:hypothetical protein